MPPAQTTDASAPPTTETPAATSEATGKQPQSAHAPSVDPDAGVGEKLLVEGVLTAQQLAKAHRVQSRLEEWRPIGGLLVEMGLVTRVRLEQARRETRRLMSLEQILISRGVLRAEQVAAAARALQPHPPADLARHLVTTGAIPERAYLEAYCEKHELPYVDLDANHVDRALLAKANLKYLAKIQVLPIAVRAGSLHLASTALLSDRVRAEMEQNYRLPITLWIAESARRST